MLVSVIVPVYNAELYISACINSILSQSYSNIELVLVDDGSKDSSYDLCKQLIAVADKAQLIHQENSGVTQARKTGVIHSHGEYVFFVDADDYIKPNAVFEYVQKLSEGDYDIVVSEKKAYNVSKAEYIADLLKGKVSCCIWGKLFKAAILKEHSDSIFDISREITVAEDYIMNIRIANYAGSIGGIHDSYYVYRDNPVSVTHTRVLNLEYEERFMAEIWKALGTEATAYEVPYLKFQLHVLENLIVCRVKVPYSRWWIKQAIRNGKKHSLSLRENIVVYVNDQFICRYVLALERKFRLLFQK